MCRQAIGLECFAALHYNWAEPSNHYRRQSRTTSSEAFDDGPAPVSGALPTFDLPVRPAHKRRLRCWALC
jgi:hypothetical protein